MNLSNAFLTMRNLHKTDSRTMAKKTNGEYSIRSIQNFMAKGANPTLKNIQLCCELIGCKVSDLMIEAERYEQGE